jgi:hypothetical protein
MEMMKKMTIDEAINEMESTAERYYKLIETNNNGWGFLGNGRETCMNYANNKAQMVDWLKDYQRLLAKETKLD